MSLSKVTRHSRNKRGRVRLRRAASWGDKAASTRAIHESSTKTFEARIGIPYERTQIVSANAITKPRSLQQDEEGNDGAMMHRAGSTTSSAAARAAAEQRKVGVANETYFRPGPMNILPLRRLFIERQVQPEMLSFVNTEEVLDLFKM